MLSNLEKKVLNELISELGAPINVTSLELITDIEAYGTLEIENGNWFYWSWNNKLYKFTVTNLNAEEMDYYIGNKRIANDYYQLSY